MASCFRHVVVLSRKNRSFCHVLGYIEEVNHSNKDLEGDETNLALGTTTVFVSFDARSRGDFGCMDFSTSRR